MSLYDKVLGCLVGSASADAIGAATECRTTEQIKKYFGGLVKDFQDPPNDTFAQGNKAGQCTDDFWQGYFILNSIIKFKGAVNFDVVKDGFSYWIKHPNYLNFTGPTTRQAMSLIFGDNRQSFQGSLEDKSSPVAKNIINDGNSKASNGGAMKIFSAAVINPGNFDKTLKDACEITKFTHNNTLSISGACAVACAISEALKEDTNMDAIIDAGIRGAKEGFDLAVKENASEVAGPGVVSRIKLAVEIADKHTSWEDAMVEIGDVIGNGLHVSEAVPAAFGLVKASKGNPLDGIFGGVNIGNDTDTIAIMVGGILGAWKGIEAFPKHYLETIDKMNNMDLKKTAQEVVDLVNK